MKVVLATDARTAGGVGRHIADLAWGLRERGADVRLAAPDGSSLERTAADLGAGFRPFSSGIERADIWHLHLADTYARISPRLLSRARLTGRRVLVTEHLPRSNASDASLSDDPRTPGAAAAKWGFKRIQLALAHSVVTVSAGSRRFLIDRYGLPPERVVHINNGIRLEPLRAMSVPPTGNLPPIVVAVGSLIRQKGHDVLIRSAALSRHGWQVVVAGSGPQQDSLRRLADEVAPGRVRFHGWVDDIPTLMRDAAVVCMPSRWESFGYVLLEAMALGRPVVATRVDGMDEVLTDGMTGLLVPPDDPAALATAVDRLVGDTALAGEVVARAGAAVSAFDLDSMIDKTLTHYRSLL